MSRDRFSAEIDYLGSGSKRRNRARRRRLREGRGRSGSLSRKTKWGIVVMGVGFLLFNCWWPQYQKIDALKQRGAELQNRKAELQANNQVLQEKINWLGTEAAVERMAREELGLIKPGEQVLMKVNQAK
ncbi:MAG: septum formation initiator family protein [Syntrophomonadaceae bacterium]|nr:septum formation initiator family protein [Syntrophomonadaceae bacterium]